jgi:membrane protease YdiL (CAAX protease family)
MGNRAVLVIVRRPQGMDMTTFSVFSRKPISHAIALGTVVLLWMSYTALQTLFVTGHVTEVWSAILGFVPGITGIIFLAATGLTREQLFLRMAPLSWRGLAVLIGIFAFALAAIVPFGKWQGWNWMVALVYAPASGISQELFFRAVLLPAVLLVLKRRSRAAIVLHALLFSLWHMGPFFVGAPLWAAVAVMFVPFLSGIGWGWQAQHDRTVFWAAVQHSLIWVIGGQFPISQ